MLEPPGDLRLLEEPAQALGVPSALGLEELERDLTVQLGIAGHEDLAEGACGVKAEVAEIGPRRGRLPARADSRRGAGLIGVVGLDAAQ
jgi:hypothetical protein